MKNFFKILLSAAAVFIFNITAAQAERYQVTVKNLTREQVFSQVFAFTHNGSHQLFTAGEPASPELAALAQDADTSGLNTLLSTSPAVHDIVIGAGAIPPGHFESILINSNHHKNYISLAAMLVTTNDAFVAVNQIKLPKRHSVFTAYAYDAGAEANDESCDYIPGPPCNNLNAASDLAGENFVHIHAGIHGIGDLSAAEYDWRNPVAEISIRRIKKHD